ncbi:hypothetical protein IFM89_018656 [Coptis chinensis]|uniref:Uncharacterized protein n=1 Tax=Coptis chinensis TaxID=261450 RepID=A0A835M049_9MAGN|nr:hypothetical protein IFM89_018656 [Coptis chinensis]
MISLIILPFHKHLDRLSQRGIRTMNKNVLENAPCSVGIIIDRVGVLGGVLDNSSSYHVAVVFLGGADDQNVTENRFDEETLMDFKLRTTTTRKLRFGHSLGLLRILATVVSIVSSIVRLDLAFDVRLRSNENPRENKEEPRNKYLKLKKKTLIVLQVQVVYKQVLLKLQRLDSILRYKEMLGRGSDK